MKVKPARRKRYCRTKRNKPFPIRDDEDNYTEIIGRFTGFNVIVDSAQDIKFLNSMGFFGKANLSRSFPTYEIKSKPIILRRRQIELRKKWQNLQSSNKLNEIAIIVSDSESEDDDFIERLNPLLGQTLLINETLNLTLEESFFLHDTVKSLKIYYNDKLLDSDTTWTIFAETQETFIQNYVVYKYFRSRNWVVKIGLKYGGDLLLYKQGPPFYHASYLVLIDNLSVDTLTRKTDLPQRSFDWLSLIGLNRLTETAAKEVIICQIIWPTNITLNDVKKCRTSIKLLSINTILMRRWIAKQERLNKRKK